MSDVKKYPTHMALLLIDNWIDGQDKSYILAHERDGVFYSHTTNIALVDLFESQGDKILNIWEIDNSKSIGLPAIRIANKIGGFEYE